MNSGKRTSFRKLRLSRDGGRNSEIDRESRHFTQDLCSVPLPLYFACLLHYGMCDASPDNTATRGGFNERIPVADASAASMDTSRHVGNYVRARFPVVEGDRGSLHESTRRHAACCGRYLDGCCVRRTGNKRRRLPGMKLRPTRCHCAYVYLCARARGRVNSKQRKARGGEGSQGRPLNKPRKARMAWSAASVIKLIKLYRGCRMNHARGA